METYVREKILCGFCAEFCRNDPEKVFPVFSGIFFFQKMIPGDPSLTTFI